MKKIKIGVVGCGGICKATYMENLVNRFAITEVIGCYDLLEYRMDYMVKKYGIKKYGSLEEICSDPNIDVICNLTFPEAHVLVSKTAMEHGKHVYCEKMMAPTFEDAKMLMTLAAEKGVLYTTAPDTFLGGWEQSARKYLDEGIIGKPVTVHAQITNHYQPDSPFFDLTPNHYFFPLHYGGGLPFDLGGYYIHEMINLFGSVVRVCGFGGNMDPHRKLLNPKHPHYGEPFEVNTPTTLLASLEFENGVLGTLHISSDSSASHSFVVTGTDGTFYLGDPNLFCDEISVMRRGAHPEMTRIRPGQQPVTQAAAAEADPDRQQLAEPVASQRVVLPLLHGFYAMSCRGVGLADMCYALCNGRRPRCHADIGFHAIEIIHGILESCRTRIYYEMTTRCERPAMLRPSALSDTAQEAVLDD